MIIIDADMLSSTNEITQLQEVIRTRRRAGENKDRNEDPRITVTLHRMYVRKKPSNYGTTLEPDLNKRSA